MLGIIGFGRSAFSGLEVSGIQLRTAAHYAREPKTLIFHLQPQWDWSVRKPSPANNTVRRPPSGKDQFLTFGVQPVVYLAQRGIGSPRRVSNVQPNCQLQDFRLML